MTTDRIVEVPYDRVVEVERVVQVPIEVNEYVDTVYEVLDPVVRDHVKHRSPDV